MERRLISGETKESPVMIKQRRMCGPTIVTLSSGTPQSLITVNWRNVCQSDGTLSETG